MSDFPVVPTKYASNQIQIDSGISSKKYVFILALIYALLIGMYFLQRPVSRFLRRVLGCQRREHFVDGIHLDSSITRSCCAGELHRSMYEQHDGATHITCDERDYRSWTVEQVVYWIQSKLTVQYRHCSRMGSNPIATLEHPSLLFRGCNSLRRDYNHSRSILRTVQLLQRECIDGPSLEYLTLNHLISFGIPFGMAVHLKCAIKGLLSVHSSRRQLNADESSSHRLRNGCALPLWYETENNGSARASLIGEVDIEMTEGLHQIMKDRFGISLPALRGNGSIDQESMTSNTSGGIVESIQISHSDETYHNNGPSLINVANFDEILKEMPPIIRAVAERHPSLVSRLLAEKQQLEIKSNPEMVHLPSTTASASLEPMREKNYMTQDLSESGEGFTNDEEAILDSECASLLRRRINNTSNLNR